MDDTRFDELIWMSRNELVFMIEELESKNVELEKNNEMLAHQLKYAETIITEVQAYKYKLRERLELTIRALGFYADRSNYLGNPSLIDMHDNGDKAREVIKILGKTLDYIKPERV